MPRKQTTIAALDESIAKWKTRLRRALNALDRLETKKKRLIKTNALATLAGTRPTPQFSMIGIAAPLKQIGGFSGTVTVETASLANDAAIEREIELAEQKREAQIADDDAFDIPPELNRADPLIAERMTAARKAAEAHARKAMPLSGKAASEYINKATKNPRKRKV